MAGILTRVTWTPSGGSASVIVPEQGNENIAVNDIALHQPGVGTHTYAAQCKLGDATDSPLPRSRRRVLVVMRFRK